MNIRTVRTSAAVGCAVALLLGVSALGGGSALANDSKKGGFAAPGELGGHSIGHTTVQVTDPSRNLDGSTPATSAGRYLNVDI